MAGSVTSLAGLLCCSGRGARTEQDDAAFANFGGGNRGGDRGGEWHKIMLLCLSFCLTLCARVSVPAGCRATATAGCFLLTLLCKSTYYCSTVCVQVTGAGVGTTDEQEQFLMTRSDGARLQSAGGSARGAYSLY